MSTQEFRELIRKLDLLIKLIALNIVQDKKFKEQVKLLSSLGLQPKEIAWLLGKTSNYVRVTLHELRKGKKPSKKRLSLVKSTHDDK